MKKVKIGIIGCGRMGQYHLNILANLPEAHIIGIADINQERMNDLCYKFEVPGFPSEDRLIDKCDAILIASPTSTHYRIAKKCLEQEKHILLEKPMTTDLDEAKELISLGEKKKLNIQIGHVERFNSAVQQLKNIVNNPIFLETKRMGPYDPRISDVGVVLDLMIHDIDILLNLIEEDVREINAVGRSVYSHFEDIAAAQIVFESGCIASILASRTSQKKQRLLNIVQKDLFAVLDFGTQDIEIHRMAKDAYLLTHNEIRYSQESFIERLSIQKDNPLKLELLHFLNCVLKKEEPVVSNELDLKALDISLKIMKLIADKKQTS